MTPNNQQIISDFASFNKKDISLGELTITMQHIVKCVKPICGNDVKLNGFNLVNHYENILSSIGTLSQMNDTAFWEITENQNYLIRPYIDAVTTEFCIVYAISVKNGLYSVELKKDMFCV